MAELPDDSVAHAHAALTDPCYWGTDECEVGELREVVHEEGLGALDTAATPLPCLTTDDGCDLEARAGLPSGFDLAEVSDGLDQILRHPCYWDQACEAFA